MKQLEVENDKQKQILPGDYQLQVHIIEVRDLYSGRSEDPKPVVMVECAKIKKMSSAGAASRSQVIDEVVFIEMKQLDKASWWGTCGVWLPSMPVGLLLSVWILYCIGMVVL